MVRGKIKDFISKSNLLVSRTKEYQEKLDEMLRISKELLWSDIFSDTVRGYSWYNEKSLSLGRWAIGYNYAYVLARVLEEFRPTNILECGLGQSSKIIVDYVSAYNVTSYDIVEQDKNWVDFFSANANFSERIQFNIRNIIESENRFGGEKTYIYEDFGSIVTGKKYDLLSIDGPWGSEKYSRIDVLEHIPSILKENFVIMIDDYNRSGEKNMVELLKERLRASNIVYYTGKYEGTKDVCIIVSEDWKFLTTM